MFILGIETSCDETAAAVVQDGRVVLSNVVASQVELHRRYGGVFPEMASRQHMIAITPVIRQALDEAGVEWSDIAAIAVVYGPGLAGSLLVGVNTAKSLAWAKGIPLVGVNHLEAHVYANWLVPPGQDPKDFVPPSFPAVCLVVSGGHTDLILVREHHDYERLGRTTDDAAGEAFDKVARLLGLGYPGGPAIQRAAEEGNSEAFRLPKALRVGPYDFSFSGLKTAVLRLVQELQREQGIPTSKDQKLAEVSLAEEGDKFPLADLAASFQAAVVGALVEKTAKAVEEYGAVQVLLAGGVAANKLLRQEIHRQVKVPVRYPPIRYCTDNAAMVAGAGYYRFLAGERSGWDLDVRPNLPLV
ncbi:MAG: tRNA (adenosine(37)-N6)-threonylcarbamoyltransferase complex transferase subunit TsaD [Anaerolineae bacterium]|nr:tRNA (adenosine(37)-N6)-threonylcarbamoyltransferase complex transferase subunit TsaD [Anaerolineae bacterium]